MLWNTKVVYGIKGQFVTVMPKITLRTVILYARV